MAEKKAESDSYTGWLTCEMNVGRCLRSMKKIVRNLYHYGSTGRKVVT